MDQSAKQFDFWNKEKKIIDKKSMPVPFFKEREVWRCSVGLNIGIETNGKSHLFERPVLVIKIFNRDMLWVLPVSSKIKKDNFHHIYENRTGTFSVKLSQLRVISAKRLIRKTDVIDNANFLEVKQKIRSFLN